MKKIIFGLIATVLIGFNSTAQTTKESWLKMIENHKVNIDRILNSEKPKDIDLKKFKEQIVLGERKLSEKSNNEIITSSIPLKTYASEFIRKNNILVDSDDELIFYAGFYPDFPINDGNFETLGITADELWYCALEAAGVGSSPLKASLETLAENFDQRCRKIACRQKTELSKELEETVSILTG